MDRTWADVTDQLTALVKRARPDRFVLVDSNRRLYGTEAPYAQGTPGPSGWYVELSFMARMAFGHHEPVKAWLREHQWNEPDGETANWWRSSVPVDDVPDVMIQALRNGYNCQDPTTYLFDSGPLPSGPRGGEPLPVADPASERILRVA